MTQFKSKPFAVHLTELTGCKSNKFFDPGFLYRMLTIFFLINEMNLLNTIKIYFIEQR
jgi:hypothetical protein